MLRAYAGGTLLGDVIGADAPRVIALPGWSRTHVDFQRVLEGLDAVALDPPGFGDSPPPPEPWGAAEYAAAVAPVLADLPEPPVVVGHSFGGRVAVALAASRPELVRGLVLVGVPLLRLSAPPAPPLAYRVARWLNRRGFLSDASMEARRRRSGSVEYRAVTGVMRDVHVRAVNETYEPLLPDVRCHVELLWAENDDAVPVGVAHAAARVLPDAAVTVLDGGGHLLPLTRPGDVRAAIDRALALPGVGAG